MGCGKILVGMDQVSEKQVEASWAFPAAVVQASIRPHYSPLGSVSTPGTRASFLLLVLPQ